MTGRIRIEPTSTKYFVYGWAPSPFYSCNVKGSYRVLTRARFLRTLRVGRWFIDKLGRLFTRCKRCDQIFEFNKTHIHKRGLTKSHYMGSCYECPHCGSSGSYYFEGWKEWQDKLRNSQGQRSSMGQHCLGGRKNHHRKKRSTRTSIRKVSLSGRNRS